MVRVAELGGGSSVSQQQHWLGDRTWPSAVIWDGGDLVVLHVVGTDVVLSRLDALGSATRWQTVVGVVPQETWWVDLVLANGRYWTVVWNDTLRHLTLRAVDSNGALAGNPVEADWSTDNFWDMRATPSLLVATGVSSAGPTRPVLMFFDAATGAPAGRWNPEVPTAAAASSASIPALASGPCGMGAVFKVWVGAEPQLLFARLGC